MWTATVDLLNDTDNRIAKTTPIVRRYCPCLYCPQAKWRGRSLFVPLLSAPLLSAPLLSVPLLPTSRIKRAESWACLYCPQCAFIVHMYVCTLHTNMYCMYIIQVYVCTYKYVLYLSVVLASTQLATTQKYIHK